ncbi:MAG: hypothetical protein ACQEQF_09285, partial [Bacillota bacterium]
DLYIEMRKIVDKLEKGEKVKDVNKGLQSLFSPQVQPFLISWFSYEPQNLIKNSNTEMLIIENGDKELKEDIINNSNIKYLNMENFIEDNGNIVSELKENLNDFILKQSIKKE